MHPVPVMKFLHGRIYKERTCKPLKTAVTANDDGNTVKVKVNPFWCQTSKYACWKLKLSIWLFNLIVVCYSPETRSCSLVTPQHDLDDVTLPAIWTWTTGLFTQWQLSSWGSIHTCLFPSEQWVTLILHQPYIRLTLHHPIKPPTFQIWLHFEKKKKKKAPPQSQLHTTCEDLSLIYSHLNVIILLAFITIKHNMYVIIPVTNHKLALL